MIKEMFDLALLLLVSPRRGAEAARQETNLRPSLRIYAFFLLASAAFLWLKPVNFPDANAAIVPEQGLGFWLKSMAWQPPLEAGWIVFLLALARWFNKGSWPVRFAAAAAWTALPFLAFVFYGQGHWSRLFLHAAFVLWAGPAVIILRGVKPSEWKPLACFMLAINVIGVALILPMAAAALFRWNGFFTFTQAAGGLWMLAFASLGLRELTGLRLPRAFMAVLLSMFFQIALAFHLHLTGLVPKEILKALFYA